MITTVTLNPSVDKLYLVERLERGAVMRVKEVHNSAGGKGLNVARVAALLGEPVVATGILGGSAGQYLCRLLEEDGVAHDFVEAPVETRSCVNIRDLSRGEHTELLEPGPPLPPEVFEAFLERYRRAAGQSGAITISGSVPAGTPEDLYLRLVEIAGAAGCPVILDTSGEALRRGIGARPTMVKPNREELGQLLQKPPAGIAEAARDAMALRDQGIPWVVVSLGGDGAVAASPEGLYRGYVPSLPVVNTVGCGDSMVAAFAVALARRLPAQEAVRLALAVSAANALSLRTGWFCQEDLKRLMPQVSVEELSL